MATKIKRSDRVALVRAALTPDEFKTTGQIADEVGLSPGLVGSTIRMIQETTEDEAFTYVPNLGWKVAENWNEKVGYVKWLHRHLTTRAASLSRHIDVARGLWGDQVPAMLAASMEFAVRALDFATSHIPSEPEVAEMSGPSRTEVIR